MQLCIEQSLVIRTSHALKNILIYQCQLAHYFNQLSPMFIKNLALECNHEANPYRWRKTCQVRNIVVRFCKIK